MNQKKGGPLSLGWLANFNGALVNYQQVRFELLIVVFGMLSEENKTVSLLRMMRFALFGSTN